MEPFVCLKKIEIFGFKSFADRTEILFDKGVTCIVGPNGCGKSNVSDAMRWVLGERSAKMLRGSEMLDVIFAGTELRKPLSLAEVNLTFDNHSRWLPIDFSEVVITRRLYRTGESEYLINKTRCRYRDIQSLIVDTGLGVDTYSMIEQGRVDSILNASPEERRGLIEEAAGIAKFKTQKDEALRKLQHTEENLLRLKDIVLEVERNIKYAERQAKRAERYKKQLEELRRLDITKAFMDMAVWRAERDLIQSEIIKLKEEIVRTEENQNLERSKLGDLEIRLTKCEKALREEFEHRADFRGKQVHAQEQLAAYESQISEAQSSVKRAELEISEAEAKTAELSKQLEQLAVEAIPAEDTARRETLELQLASKKENWASLKEKVANERDAVEKMRLRTFEIADSYLKAKNELQRLQSEIQFESQRRLRLQGSLERRCEELKALKEDFANLEDERLGAERIHKNTFEDHAAYTQKRKKLDEEREQLHAKIRSKESERNELSARLDMLKGFGKKGLLPWLTAHTMLAEDGESSERFEHLTEAITSVIRPKPGHETFYRLAVGKFIGAVVVKDAQVADELIEYIKKQKLGEALVLLADRPASEWVTSDGLARHPLVRGPAIDFVECTPGYERLAASILSGTYFTAPWNQENRGELRSLAHKARLITEDGMIIGPGSRIHGRFQGTTFESSLPIDKNAWLYSKKRAAEIEAEIKGLHVQLETCKNECESTQRWFDVHENNVRSAQVTFESGDRIKAQIVQDIKHLEEEMRITEKDIQESESREKLHVDTIAQLQQSAVCLEKDEADARTLLEQAVLSLGIVEVEKEQLTAEVSQLESECKHFRANEELKASSYASMQKNVELMESLMASKRQLIKEAGEKENRSRIAMDELRVGMAKLENEAGVRTETIANLEREMDELKTERRGGSETIERLHQKISSLKDAEHGKNLACSDLNHRDESLRQQITQSYKVDFSTTTSAEYPPPSPEEMAAFEERREHLKKNMESMGTVNLLAVEEYEELKTRYDFLTTQQKDLEDARLALLEAIRKINRTTRTLFQDTFFKVQSSFEAYYRILFRGGHAELILLDESNPLESGIDIHVRPPGKKLQHVSLLSGGEKALTAIALLFALFKVKPSPFCVLDEVDAPLDEANVDRFLEVLNEFLSITQFLIITHNRKTIAKGSTLYGVTMEESGVSKVVSVRVADEIKEKEAGVAKESVTELSV